MNQETIKPKKVLFIITKATWGGAQRYVFDLARSLPRDKYLPVVAYGVPGILAEKLKTAGIETHEVPALRRDMSVSADVAAYRSLVKLIGALKPEIVHVNSSKAAFLGALAARHKGLRRIVFTVHGWPFKERRALPLRHLFHLVSYLTALIAHVVIVVSPEDQKLGEAMRGIGLKLCYVPVGIEPISYVSREEALQALWGIVPQDRLPRDAIKIVTIAELTPNKGIRYAIEALHDLSTRSSVNYAYILIGEGEQKEELTQLAEAQFVGEKVFFLGFVPNASAFLPAFDIFLLPSIKEGMPYVLLEAGDSGMPVIATDVVSRSLAESYHQMRIVRASNSFAISDAIQNTGPWSGIPSSQGAHFPLADMVKRTLEIYG